MDMFRKPAMDAVSEIAKVVEAKAKESFLRQRSSKNKNYTGMLIASFQQMPVTVEGNTRFKAIVFAGGPTAPYAPFVEWIGWKFRDGSTKHPYFFMEEGAIKGGEEAGQIVIKNFSSITR